MRASFKSIQITGSWSIPTIIICLAAVAFSLTAIPARAGGAEDKAKKAFADWKAAQGAVAAAKEKLADAQKALQNAMTAVAESGGQPTAAQEAALAQGREAVARAEAALRAAEKQELAARVALESAIAELPDGELKDQLKRERNFPSLVAANGLYTVKFDTPSGQLKLNLPDDMRAGETISGTVVPEPKGNTEEERNSNRGVLNGYVVDIAGQKFPVNKGSVGPMIIPLRQSPSGPGIPPSLDSFFDVFFAVDLSSSGLGPVRIPLQPTHPSGAIITPDPKITQPTHPSGAIITPDPKITRPIPDAKITPPPPPPGDIITITGEGFRSQPDDVDMIPGFNIPRLGQQGRPMVIPGPFDGDSSNTGVSWTPVGSTNPRTSFNVIAESPRKTVVTAPTNVAGLLEVSLTEGGKEKIGQFRNVAVELTAPRTSLLRGESTELRVQVNGLEGLKTPVPLTLECTGVITMAGGNYQPLTIQPSQVGPDGSYSTTRGITGVQAGGWGATATVVTGPFNVCFRDDSRAATVLLWNSVSGDYSFRPPGGASAPPTGGARLTGEGTMVMKGCVLTLTHNAPDRRVFSKLDTCTNSGQASVQTTSPKAKFTITDRNISDSGPCPN